MTLPPTSGEEPFVFSHLIAFIRFLLHFQLSLWVPSGKREEREEPNALREGFDVLCAAQEPKTFESCFRVLNWQPFNYGAQV